MTEFVGCCSNGNFEKCLLFVCVVPLRSLMLVKSRKVNFIFKTSVSQTLDYWFDLCFKYSYTILKIKKCFLAFKVFPILINSVNFS